MATVREFRATYGVAAAFLLVSFFGGWAIHASASHQAQRLYQTQLASCERGNDIRRESNRRIPSERADADVLREFLSNAAAAREASYRRDHQPSDLLAAQQYRAGVRTLDAKVSFATLPLVNCKAVIAKP